MLEPHARGGEPDVEVLTALGLALARTGRHKQALETLALARAREPGNAMILVEMGTVHLMAGEREPAREAFGAALGLNPSVARAHSSLGFMAAESGRVDEAARPLAQGAGPRSAGVREAPGPGRLALAPRSAGRRPPLPRPLRGRSAPRPVRARDRARPRPADRRRPAGVGGRVAGRVRIESDVALPIATHDPPHSLLRRRVARWPASSSRRGPPRRRCPTPRLHSSAPWPRPRAVCARARRRSAESHYRSALQEGWQLRGDLATVEGRLTEARDAFRAASVSAVENRRALQSLVLAHLQLREAAQAVEILTRLLSKNPRDLPIRKLLAQALVANGQTSEAVQELEEAYAGAPEDDELAFTLALGYLRLKKVDRPSASSRRSCGAADPPDPRAHRPHLPRLRRVRAGEGRAASGPRDGPPRTPCPLPPRAWWRWRSGEASRTRRSPSSRPS